MFISLVSLAEKLLTKTTVWELLQFRFIIVAPGHELFILNHCRVAHNLPRTSHQGPHALKPPTFAAPDNTSHFPIFPSEQNGCLRLIPRTCSIHSLPSAASPSANSGNCSRTLFSVASNCPATERKCFDFSLGAASWTLSQVSSRASRWAWSVQ